MTRRAREGLRLGVCRHLDDHSGRITRAGMVTALCVLALCSAARGQRPPDFGKNWVRTHDFAIFGASADPDILDINEYQAVNFSAFMPYGSANQIYTASAAGMDWMGTFHTNWNDVVVPPFPYDGAMQWIAQFENGAPGGIGWNLGDEVIGVWMEKMASLVAAYKQEYPDPDKLTWVASTGLTLSPAYMYGSTPPPGYDADQYLEDLITIIDPDIVGAVGLHFYTNNVTDKNVWFINIMKTRSHTQAHNMPFFQWIQAYSLAEGNVRKPSESDLRAEIYATLTCGAKGIVYGAYSGWHDESLLDNNGDPTPLYYHAADVNLEIATLGQHLRFLESTDVRFIPGEDGSGQKNPTPSELTDWAPGAGNDPHIQDVYVYDAAGSNAHPDKNGLIGFFTDDEGFQYFMLTNLYHAEDTSAADTSLEFVIEFDDTVEALIRIDQETGQELDVALPNDTLNVTLPGGTGYLYYYKLLVRPQQGTLIFQDGRKYPDDAIYAGTQEAHIVQKYSLNNTGGNDVLEAARPTGTDASDDRSIVIKFTNMDTSLEAGKSLQQAILTLDYFDCRNDPGGVTKTLYVHKLLHDWGEGTKTGLDGELAGAGEVTWTKPFGATGGENPNWNGTLDAQYADPVALDSASLASGAYGAVSFDVTAAVAEHLASPSSNFGFVIREEQGSESTQDGTRQFHSRAGKIHQRPSLKLTFEAVVHPEPGTLIFQDGRKYPDQTTYTGTEDAHIVQKYSLNNTGGNDVLEAARGTGSDVSDDRSVVIRFTQLDTSLEAGKYLQQAMLTLNYFNSRNDPGGVSKTLYAHKLLHDWGEGSKVGINGEPAGAGEVTWTKPFGATGAGNPNWNGTLDAQYADPVALDSASLASGAYGAVSFDVTAAVADHLASPSTNFGFVIREENGSESTEDGARQFHSREHAEITARPSLTLTFVDQPPPVSIESVATMADHGPAGELGLTVNLTASSLPGDSALVTTESREDGITKLVIDCDGDVSLPATPEDAVESIIGVNNGDVTANVVSVTAVADVMTINLTALPDEDTYTVTLAGSVIAGDRDFLIRSLQGEVDNGGSSSQAVNALDLSAVRLNFTADVTVGDNAKYDIISDGAINALDLSQCRIMFTHTAP